MKDFIHPEEVPLIDMPEPVLGRELYGIRALLASDGTVADEGVRPGNIELTRGTVDGILPGVPGGRNTIALLRLVTNSQVVFDPEGLSSLIPSFANRQGPYYASFNPSTRTVNYALHDRGLGIGSLVVGVEGHGSGGASIHFRDPYGMTPDGDHRLNRVTDDPDVAQSVVRALASAMRLPAGATEWLIGQFFPAQE